MLKLSETLSLPIEAVTQTFAFLGRRGSGKTYGAGKLAELMLDAGAQIVALDPIGVWYGLRLSADGKKKGFSVPVFGGDHGDVPLEPQAGRLIAKLIVEERFSAILDVSTFRKTERKQFVTDFADELMHRKKSSRTALHVFFEESQLFVPQHVTGKEAAMVGAFEDLIKLGRNYGIGASLISQRPQSVNKDVLNQTEVLLAFQMTGPQERKTIDGWISDKGIDEKLADVLPSLKVGYAHLWSPQWLQISETIHIAKKKTFDASSTPTVGAAIVEPKELSPVDVEQIKSAMSDVVKRADENDPKKLRAEITKLTRELAAKLTQIAPEPIVKEIPIIPAKEIEALTAEIAGFRKDYTEKLERITQGFEALNGAKVLGKIEDVGNKILANIPQTSFEVPKPFQRRQASATVPIARPIPQRPPAVIPKTPASGDIGDLKKAERMMLQAFYWTKDDNAVTPAKLGFYAGYTAGAGAFNNALGSLRSKGLVIGLTLTDEGSRLASTYAETKPAGSELREWLRPKLNKAANEVLDALIGLYPNRVTPEEIANATVSQYTAGAGAFNNALGRLRSLEAAEGYGKEGVKAADVFFE